MPTIDRPESLIIPLSGLISPTRVLKNVVLPAPLGPINPTICPSVTEKLTSESA